MVDPKDKFEEGECYSIYIGFRRHLWGAVFARLVWRDELFRYWVFGSDIGYWFTLLEIRLHAVQSG